MDQVRPGIYRPFKCGFYEVLGEALHTETGHRRVIYRMLYGTYELLERDRENFCEEVERDGYKGPRFAPVKLF